MFRPSLSLPAAGPEGAVMARPHSSTHCSSSFQNPTAFHNAVITAPHNCHFQAPSHLKQSFRRPRTRLLPSNSKCLGRKSKPNHKVKSSESFRVCADTSGAAWKPLIGLSQSANHSTEKRSAPKAVRAQVNAPQKSNAAEDSNIWTRRHAVASFAVLGSFLALVPLSRAAAAALEPSRVQSEGAPSSKKANVFELKGGVKALDVRIGTGPVPQEGDTVAIHYYGRLGAKQGWRFDSSYEHKDVFGVPEPYVFTVGSGRVIAGIDTAVQSMRVGGIRRVVIPPSQGYQNKEQGPVPPDFFDRQRLYTTIFNPTRLANGEGSTLGTVIFDLELVRVQN